MISLIRKRYLLVFAVALLVRVAYCVIIPQLEGGQLGDTRIYDKLAKAIVSGFGYERDARWPPLYPLFLAGVYMFFGSGFLAVRLIQAFLGALTALLVFILIKSLSL